MKILLIGGGGFVGAILRYLVGGWAQRLPSGDSFPVGTLMVNVTGCLAIGMLAELAEGRGALAPEARAFLMIGVLGAYTTFSALAHESLNLVRTGEAALAVLNITASVVSGVLAAWAGRWLAHAIWG